MSYSSFDGGLPFPHPLVNGATAYTLFGLPAGTYQLTATYAAQGNYQASQARTVLTVTAVAPAVGLIGDPQSSDSENARALQYAIDHAHPGSVLVLNHLVAFKGNFNLPNISNPSGRYITLVSDAVANLPALDPTRPMI